MPVSNVRFSMSSNSHVLADGKVRHAMWRSRHGWASEALAVILKPVSHKEHLRIVTLSFLGLDDISLGITHGRSQVEVLGAPWKKGPSSAQTIYVSDDTVLCLVSPPCTLCPSLGLSGFRWCSQETGYRGTRQVSKRAKKWLACYCWRLYNFNYK